MGMKTKEKKFTKVIISARSEREKLEISWIEIASICQKSMLLPKYSNWKT